MFGKPTWEILTFLLIENIRHSLQIVHVDQFAMTYHKNLSTVNILGAHLEVSSQIQVYQHLLFDRTKLSKLLKLSFLIFEFHKNFRNCTSSQVYVRKITKWHPDIIKNSFFSLFTTKCDNEREFHFQNWVSTMNSGSGPELESVEPW